MGDASPEQCLTTLKVSGDVLVVNSSYRRGWHCRSRDSDAPRSYADRFACLFQSLRNHSVAWSRVCNGVFALAECRLAKQISRLCCQHWGGGWSVLSLQPRLQPLVIQSCPLWSLELLRLHDGGRPNST